MKNLFGSLDVEPHVVRYVPGPDGHLAHFVVNVYAFDVSEDFVHQVTTVWFEGAAVDVGFLHDSQWCTGKVFVSEVTPSIGPELRVLNCYIHLVGTKELTCRPI